MESLANAAKDILPVPDNFEMVTNPEGPENPETAPSLADSPTMSHALAVADHDEKGVAQESHDEVARDLGWHEKDEKVPDPLVGGIANEQLWLLLRRFNKVNETHAFRSNDERADSLPANLRCS